MNQRARPEVFSSEPESDIVSCSVVSDSLQPHVL